MATSPNGAQGIDDLLLVFRAVLMATCADAGTPNGPVVSLPGAPPNGSQAVTSLATSNASMATAGAWWTLGEARCSIGLTEAPKRLRGSYLILAKHSFTRSSSERTCETSAFCNAAMPLLKNSPEAFLSRFCCQSRIAVLVAFWASDVDLT